MTTLFTRGFALVLFLLPLTLGGQQQADPRVSAVYSNLVGTWTGQHKDLTKHVPQFIPLRIEIVQEPDRDRLRWDYFYGVKGKPHYEHKVRFLRIYPKDETVSFNWEGEKETPGGAENLDEVLKNGTGNFRVLQAVSVWTDKILYRATFNVTNEKIDYLWQVAAGGRGFIPMSRITVLRVLQPSTGNASQTSEPLKPQ